MTRDDFFSLIGSGLLLLVGWVDLQWRWFWWICGGFLLLWSLATTIQHWRNRG